jgi:hypothetical protein
VSAGPGDPVGDLEFVDVCVADLVATVTLRRPPVNALSAPMMREIARVFTACPGRRPPPSPYAGEAGDEPGGAPAA